MNKFRWNFMCR